MCVYTYTFIPVFMFIQMHTKQTILFPSLKKKSSTENSILSDCDLEEKYFEEIGFSNSNSFENLSQ